MLKYIWMVIQDLFLTVTFATLIYTVLERRYGRRTVFVHRIFTFTGAAASIALAVVKNTTNKIVSSQWNHYIYIVIILCTLLFAVFALIFRGEKKAAWKPGGLLLSLSGGALTAVWIFYSLPGAIAYPFNFNTMGNGYLSWYYGQRLLGWILAYLILIIYARLLYACASQIKNAAIPWVILITGLVTSAFYCFGRYLIPWVNRAKWLKWPVKYTKEQYGWAGSLMMFTSKYAMFFIWLVAAMAAVLLVMFFAENIKITEAYDNPAQKRKLRARNRRHRRQSVGLLVFLTMAVFSMSVVKAYDTREITLSEPESYTVEEDRILVPMDSVSDGHLHRFEYTTEDGVDIRWIVVKKPGSASFGVGFDACEVCGDAGYYERNGQVVCKRCDVVMNINTIGFKGGCNPIPVSYEVEGGSLVFSLEELLAGEREFA